ncbi:hypothetical protein ABZW96_35970 [Nocardia sp. NPDC004168]|uniref:NACHT domain-containing protein n=1 Tax=Nocardia sp. NPDC004168 TaxID=3154452 RepID=UPI0033A9E5F4
MSLPELMRAQVRAAREPPYRIFGPRTQILPDVYVRPMLRDLTAESEMEDRDAEKAKAENRAGKRPDNRAEAPSEERQSSGRRRPLAELLDGERHRIVVAGAGGGKSTMTLHVTASLAQRWLDGDLTTRPALLPLRVTARGLAAHLSTDRQAALAAALTTELGSHLRDRIAPGLLAAAPPGTRWLLLVDGLDEITAPDTRARLIEVLAGFTDTPPATGPTESEGDRRLRLLVTTRPLDGAAWTRVLRFTDTDRYTLEPFDRDALNGFAHAWFGEDGRFLAEEFLRRLAEPRLAELAQVPLLATIAAVMVEQNPDRTLPPNRFALYEEFIAQLLARGGVEGPQHRQPSPAAVAELRGRRVELLERLAVAHLNGITELNSFLWNCASPPDDYEIPLGAWHELLTATLSDTGLVVEGSGGLRFLHQSFAEHLAARVQARELPERYRAGERRWKKAVHAATPQSNCQESAAGVALLVLEHHTHRHPDNGLIPALQRSRSADQRLLAGLLLSSGVAAAPEWTAAFLTDLGAWCEGSQRWGSRSSDAADRRMHVGLAVLPTTPHRDQVITWLRATVISAPTDVRELAARQLGAMGAEFEYEAAEALERLAARGFMEHSLWDSLVELGPEGKRRAVRLAEQAWVSNHRPSAPRCAGCRDRGRRRNARHLADHRRCSRPGG